MDWTPRFPLALLTTMATGVSAVVPCTVCKDGSAVPFPDKAINVEGIPVDTCRSLETTAGFLIQGTDFCNSVQSIGTLCGCEIPDNACNLCTDGSTVSNPSLNLPTYYANDFIFGAPEGVVLNCESMESILHNYEEDSTLCHSTRVDIATDCGCPEVEVDTILTKFPTVSPAPTVDPPESCTLCLGGEDILFPDKPLDLGDLPIENCADLVSFAALLTVESSDCAGIRSFGPLCGCPAGPDGCSLCPHGEIPSRPDQRLSWFSEFGSSISDSFQSIGESLTCEWLDSTLQSLSKETLPFEGINAALTCLSSQLKSSICGCRPDWRQRLLIWSYRTSACLSIIVRAWHRRKSSWQCCRFHSCPLTLSIPGISRHHLRYSQAVEKEKVVDVPPNGAGHLFL